MSKKIKIIGAALVMLLLAAAAFSIDITVGIKGGAGFAFYAGADYEDYKGGYDTQMLIAFAGGGFLTIGMEMVALEVDLFVTSAGGAYGDSNIVYNSIDNFIEIPILVKLRFRVDDMIVSVYAGPDILIKVGYFVEQEIDPDDGSLLDELRWPEDEMNTIQYALVIGAGIDIPFEGFYVTLDARYELGLTSRHTETSGYGEQWFQDNIQLLIGFGMDLNY
ncbi:MAG: PorT family protein [Spirochaetales bacterium]|nr:PorT family protein [Spirochaetales bacterium]